MKYVLQKVCFKKFVGFTFITALGILQFNPEFTSLNEFIVCETNGACTLYSVPMLVLNYILVILDDAHYSCYLI